MTKRRRGNPAHAWNRRRLAGARFGRLTAVADTGRRASNGAVVWRCRCDCGGVVEVISTNLGKGTRSCGCLRHEISSVPNGRR